MTISIQDALKTIAANSGFGSYAPPVIGEVGGKFTPELSRFAPSLSQFDQTVDPNWNEAAKIRAIESGALGPEISQYWNTIKGGYGRAEGDDTSGTSALSYQQQPGRWLEEMLVSPNARYAQQAIGNFNADSHAQRFGNQNAPGIFNLALGAVGGGIGADALGALGGGASSGAGGTFAPGSFWNGATAGGVSDTGFGAGGGGFGSTIDVAGQLPSGSFPGQTPAWTSGSGVNWNNLNSVDVTGQLPAGSFPGQTPPIGVSPSIPVGGTGGSGGSSAKPSSTINIGGYDIPIAALGALGGAALGGLGGSARPAGTTTTVQDIPDWLKPYVTSNINAAQQVRDQYIPQNPLMPAAQNQALQTINGQYLDPSTNPYLQSTFNQGAKSLTDAYLSATQPRTDALFGHSGNAFGDNSGYQETVARNQFGLGQNLANLATNIYGGNYQQERSRQTGMTTAAPGFVQQQTQAAFQPFTSFNSTLPNSQSTTQPYFQNPLGGALTGALGGYAFGKAFGG